MKTLAAVFGLWLVLAPLALADLARTQWPWPLQDKAESETGAKYFVYKTHDRGVAAFAPPGVKVGGVLYKTRIGINPKLAVNQCGEQLCLHVGLGASRVVPNELYKSRNAGPLEFDYVYTLNELSKAYAYQSIDRITAQFSGSFWGRQSVSINNSGRLTIPERVTHLESLRVQGVFGSGQHAQKVVITFSNAGVPPVIEALATVAGVAVTFVLLSLLIDFIPVVGTAKGLHEAWTGKDAITGEDLAWYERVLGVVPIAGGALASLVASRRAARALAGTGKHVDELAEAAARSGDDVSEAMARYEQSRRAACFTPDTLVWMGDGQLRPIEDIQIGDSIRCFDANGGVSEQPVLQTHRRVTRELYRLQIASQQGTIVLKVTPRHPIATPAGFVAAEELALQSIITCGSGETAHLVAKQPIAYTGPVVNLEIAEHHHYWVTALGIVVHNLCEAQSQRDLERILGDDDNFEFAHDWGDILADSPSRKGRKRPISMGEPAYSNGEFLGFGRDWTRKEKCDALMIDTRGWYADDDYYPAGMARELKKQMAREARMNAWRTFKEEIAARGGLTYPDVVGREVRAISNADGSISHRAVDVAYEIKTPSKHSQTVYDFFSHKENFSRNDFLHQVGGRFEHMPGQMQQDLIIDLRNMKQTPDEALADLRRLATPDENTEAAMRVYENMGGIYRNVRFIVSGDNGAQLTDLATIW